MCTCLYVPYNKANAAPGSLWDTGKENKQSACAGYRSGELMVKKMKMKWSGRRISEAEYTPIYYGLALCFIKPPSNHINIYLHSHLSVHLFIHPCLFFSYSYFYTIFIKVSRYPFTPVYTHWTLCVSVQMLLIFTQLFNYAAIQHLQSAALDNAHLNYQNKNKTKKLSVFNMMQ